MINQGLTSQLRALFAQADTSTVPCGLLTWWNPIVLPDGTAREPPCLAQREWEYYFSLLRNAALLPNRLYPEFVPPLSAVQALTRGFPPDGTLPIAIANFRVARPHLEFRQRVLKAANTGTALDPPPAGLASVIEETRAFMAAGLLHAQWSLPEPMCRSHVVTFKFDRRFYFTNLGEPLPDKIEIDVDDGGGFQRVQFGDSVTTVYPKGNQAMATVRCYYGEDCLYARLTIKFGAQRVAPPPDGIWSLRGASGNTGKAYVYHGSHSDKKDYPAAIIAEGFPGGYTYDYLYDMMNQAGLLEALRAAGYDIVLLGFDNGFDRIENNAQVAIAGIQKAMQQTKAPFVVGGVSMGGLVTRYALAYMESHGLPHQTRIFFTIDTPHRGAYTSLCAQWFAHFCRSVSALAADFTKLLDSPANQQFLMTWVKQGSVEESPLRKEFLRNLKNIGDYPRQPLRLAVACGRGDGKRSLSPRQPLLTWSGSPLVEARLWALPENTEQAEIIAEGHGFLADPDEVTLLSAQSDVSWEGAPGGQNRHLADATHIADSLGCGKIDSPIEFTCAVPTISALDLDITPFEPIPPPDSGKSPFHDYICCQNNEPHLKITPEVSAWLLSKLAASPANTI